MVSSACTTGPQPHTTVRTRPLHGSFERIETWRREKKWSANRITHELAELDFRINRRTVTRHLTRLGLGQRRFIDPSGHSNRKPGKIIARWPGHMAHLDVKKVGRIPDGGGWRIHGCNSAQKRAVDRARTAGAKAGYLYLNSIVDGFSRLAYTEPLDDEKGTPQPHSSPEPRSGSPPTASPTSTVSSPTTAPVIAPTTSPASSAIQDYPTADVEGAFVEGRYQGCFAWFGAGTGSGWAFYSATRIPGEERPLRWVVDMRGRRWGVDFPVPEPRPDPNAVVRPDGSLQLTRDPGRTWRERSPSREVHRPGREAIAKNKPPLSLRIPRRCRGQLRPDGETANVCQRQRGSEWAVRKGLTVPGTRGPPRQ
jgi:hypothetical protein